MGRQFTYDGREFWVYQAAEGDAVFSAVRRASQELVVPAGEGCAEFVGRLGALASQYISALASSSENADPRESDVFTVFSIFEITRTQSPSADDATLFELWENDTTLRSMMSYAPLGLAVPIEWREPLEEIVAGVVAVDAGRCAIRTRWGLVGTVAVLGALVLGGGALLYANRKRR